MKTHSISIKNKKKTIIFVLLIFFLILSYIFVSYIETKATFSEKEKLSKEILEFKVKTGVGDKVFGSISVKQIKDELDKKGYKIEKNMIDIDGSISSLGFHDVKINLYQDIDTVIKIHVIK